MGFLDRLTAQINPFDGGKSFGNPMGMPSGGRQRAQAQMPMASRAITPADRDFPGRTNYGTPQDNMIDQMGGYVTPEQYNNNLITNGYPRNARYEDDGFVGDPANPNQFSPLNADVKNFRGVSPMVQPFGRSYEDELTQTMRLQPVNPNNGQVSLNSGFIQGGISQAPYNPYTQIRY